MSKLVTGFLNAIYYQNILEKESNEKYKYMLKTLKSTYQEDVFVYSDRCRKALFKVKTLLALKNMYINFHDRKAKSFSVLVSPGQSSSLNKFSRKSEINNCNESDLELKNILMTHLYELNSSTLYRQTQINEIMSPQPIYDLCEPEEYELNKLNDFDKSTVNRAESFTLMKRDKKSKRGRIKRYITNQSDYGYCVGANKKKKFIPITALQIIDREWVNEEYRRNKKRSELKTKFFILIFISSYIFLVIMVTNVYNKYEDNIFKICISPLLSVVISKFLITQNVMIFVHSFFLHFFGDKFYSDNRKTMNPMGIVFRFVIPPISKANHKALLTFLKINKNRQIIARG
jgi:hypothetical protein